MVFFYFVIKGLCDDLMVEIDVDNRMGCFDVCVDEIFKWRDSGVVFISVMM